MCRAPLALCVLGDRMLCGRNVCRAVAQLGLRVASIVEQGRGEGGGGGGVMRQFGMKETHEEAAH